MRSGAPLKVTLNCANLMAEEFRNVRKLQDNNEGKLCMIGKRRPAL